MCCKQGAVSGIHYISTIHCRTETNRNLRKNYTSIYDCNCTWSDHLTFGNDDKWNIGILIHVLFSFSLTRSWLQYRVWLPVDNNMQRFIKWQTKVFGPFDKLPSICQGIKLKICFLFYLNYNQNLTPAWHLMVPNSHANITKTTRFRSLVRFCLKITPWLMATVFDQSQWSVMGVCWDCELS